MVLQVMCRTAESEVVIELHGWLRGPEIAEFQRTCDASAPPLAIDMRHLAGASREGVLALKEQQARGARLTGASPYIDLLLRGH